jgi:hypothetical protein
VSLKRGSDDFSCVDEFGEREVLGVVSARTVHEASADAFLWRNRNPDWPARSDRLEGGTD